MDAEFRSDVDSSWGEMNECSNTLNGVLKAVRFAATDHADPCKI